MSLTLAPIRQLTLLHPLPDTEVERLHAVVPEVRLVRAGARDWVDAVAHADAVLLGHQGVTVDDLLGAAPGLRWIQTAAAGVDRVLTARLRASPVVVTNASGAHAANMAEHVMALMLGFARQLPLLRDAQQRQAWPPPPLPGLFEVEGQTALVVGLGAAGGEVARKALALGLKVTAVRRDPQAEGVPGLERTVGLAQLDEELPHADHVIVALPLTAETRGLFDAARIARMRPGAYLYNIARGALVDTAALLSALQSGHLAGAGLDVTDPEPLPAASPLWRLPQVVITCHTAGWTPNSARRLVDITIDNLLRARAGRPLRNVVDPSLGY